jgi:hypothetical protein
MDVIEDGVVSASGPRLAPDVFAQDLDADVPFQSSLRSDRTRSTTAGLLRPNDTIETSRGNAR